MGDLHLIAWAAGLFEGEGCIGVRMNRLSLTTTDKDIAYKFMSAVGCGQIYEREPSGPLSKKTQWLWVTNKTVSTKATLEAFYPYLGERRRAKADEFFSWIRRERKNTKGENNGNRKLSEDQVISIRAEVGTYAEIGRKYGVTLQNIREIKIGKTWRHLNGN